MDHEYSGIDGNPTYKDKCMKLAYGENSPILGNIASCQSLSGTGSLRVGMDFLREWYP